MVFKTGSQLTVNYRHCRTTVPSQLASSHLLQQSTLAATAMTVSRQSPRVCPQSATVRLFCGWYARVTFEAAVPDLYVYTYVLT